MDKQETTPIKDILFTQRFVPECGGVIRWMFEVYGRWPRPVSVYTHDYEKYPPKNQKNIDMESYDQSLLKPLDIVRENIQMDTWKLTRPKRLSAYLRMNRFLKREAKKNPRLLVHCCRLVPEGFLACYVARNFPGMKVVSYLHGEEILSCASSKELTKMLDWTLSHVDLIIANSEYSKSLIRSRISPDRIRIISPGVNFSLFADTRVDRKAFRDKLGIPEDAFVALTVGKVDERKNQILMVKALAELKENYPHLHYVIVGEGEHEAQIKDFCAKNGIEERVHLLGVIDDVQKISAYKSSDLFVMPSRKVRGDVEGFGMVFLEAAACGLASIGGNAGGQPEAIVPNKTGWVVDGEDLNSLMDALRKAISDESLRTEFGQAAFEHAIAKDWEVVVPQTYRTIERLVDA